MVSLTLFLVLGKCNSNVIKLSSRYFSQIKLLLINVLWFLSILPRFAYVSTPGDRLWIQVCRWPLDTWRWTLGTWRRTLGTWRWTLDICRRTLGTWVWTCGTWRWTLVTWRWSLDTSDGFRHMGMHSSNLNISSRNLKMDSSHLAIYGLKTSRDIWTLRTWRLTLATWSRALATSKCTLAALRGTLATWRVIHGPWRWNYLEMTYQEINHMEMNSKSPGDGQCPLDIDHLLTWTLDGLVQPGYDSEYLEMTSGS